jgi:hypothetical protein
MVTFRLASLVKGKSRRAIHNRCCVFLSLSLEISDWYEGGGELVSYIEAYKLLLLSFSGRGKSPLL